MARAGKLGSITGLPEPRGWLSWPFSSERSALPVAAALGTCKDFEEFASHTACWNSFPLIDFFPGIGLTNFLFIVKQFISQRTESATAQS